MIDFTSFARRVFSRRRRRTQDWSAGKSRELQREQLRWLLSKARDTEFGMAHGFGEILEKRDNPGDQETPDDIEASFRRHVPMAGYEDFRRDVMKMVLGASDVLWPGICLNYAQSSGTSGGRSKFIPVTRDSLRRNHYAGTKDVMAQYLGCYPDSRIFSGKGMILGGSFSSKLHPRDERVKIGDLSATLINDINVIANRFRVPSMETALLADWGEKLPRLAKESVGENITNISGVPSWFLRVIQKAVELKGVGNAYDVWPNMEVFFYGGISFDPYREEYSKLFPGGRMRYFQTYNASEGFFATQSEAEAVDMLLLIDNGIYYEFLEEGKEEPVGVGELEVGKTYEMIISGPNGLWRYRIGDTVEVTSLWPVKIKVAGRTSSYINAFGEELMQVNADTAIAEACRATGGMISDYTAAPVFSHGGEKGRHQWIIEWEKEPTDVGEFAEVLDKTLKECNSDYAAKREGGIFLDGPEVVTAPKGTFDRWLGGKGSGKLGGQRKIPRLSNGRKIADELLAIIKEEDRI